MEIATTSSALQLFPKDQRFKSKGVRYNLIDFSDDVSLLPINPKLDLDDPQVLSRTGGNGKEKYDVVSAPKKRQHSDEGNPPVKRQKKTVEVDSATKAKSIRTLTPSLNKTVSKSKQETNTKVPKQVDARSITTMVTKPGKSISASKACNYETKTKPDGIDMKYLIAKAKHKIHEQRVIDHRREHIARQRLAARLALNQMVATDCFDDHLNYLRELEQLGYTFIHDEVDCLNMFSLLSRSDYNGVSNSVLERNKTPWCDEDSRRKKQQRSTKGKSMEHSLQDSQITKNGGSTESSNQRQSKCQSSTSVRIQ